MVLPVAVNSVPLQIPVSLTASYLCAGAVAQMSFVAISVRIFFSPVGSEERSAVEIPLVGIIA